MNKICKVLLILALMLSVVGCSTNEASNYIAGTYTQEVQGFGGKIEVSLIVDATEIKAVEILGEDETPALGGAAIETLQTEILEKQGEDVDVVSGATVTSNAVLQALELCLKQAKGENEVIHFNAGVYEGKADGRNGVIEVEVEVDENDILSINIKNHHESEFISNRALKEIPEMIVQYQTLNVDSITGATLSSNGIKKAVENALVQAGADEALLYLKEANQTYEIPEIIDADICIVGAGLAGLSAAVKAIELGYNIVIFEESGQVGGSATVAYGWVTGAGTQVQKEAGVEDSPEHFYEDILLGAGGNIAYPEMTKVYTEKSKEIIDYWNIELGIEMGEPSWGAYAAVETPRIYDSYGGYNIVEALYDLVLEAQEKGQVTLLLDTKVTDLIIEENEVKGVVAEFKDGSTKELHYQATIMTTGGFCNNEEMLKEYVYTNITNGAPSTSNGSGLKMLMDNLDVQTPLISSAASYPAVVPFEGFNARYRANYTYPGSILVLNTGTRFYNEQYANQALWAVAPENEIYIIFNEAMIDRTQNIFVITGYNEEQLTAEESWNMFDEVLAEQEYIFKADTIEELATMMGVNAENLQATIEAYNLAAKNEAEDPFGRVNGVAMEEGPYYAMYTIPYAIQTAGGVLTDASARVLNSKNEAIVGLYAAGEIVGMNTVCAPSYGGKSLGNAAVFGTVAAETAINELVRE